MVLMSVDSLTKYINEKCIVKDASFSIDESDKIALIGTNGTGKSTLMKIVSGHEVYDNGNILTKNGLKIEYVSQNPVFSKETIWEEITSRDQKHQIEEYQFKSILTKLGLDDFNMPISQLSGGQQKRLALACSLVLPCDLLMLDEPTNHLDETMIEWLESYLMHMKSALLMVTHDRYFLDRICTKIFELDQGRFFVHQGNYEKFVISKNERQKLEKAAIEKHKNFYKKELEWVRAGVQARSTKSKSRLQRFEELRNQRFVQQEKTLELESLSHRLGKKTIEWENLGFDYSNKSIFHSFSYRLLRRDRIGIIGANGCGKSTLLNVISGSLKPTQGRIEYGDTVVLGYFRQGDDQVDLSMRMIDYIKEVAEVIDLGKQKITAAQLLERFLFPRTMHYTTIDRLSGGERRRLYLCRVLMGAPNILLLDEPTNDLDILTLDVLEDYLDQFPGAIITVSHDRYFLDRVCDKVFVHQNDQTWKLYNGGYSDYKIKQENQKVVVSKPKRERSKRNWSYKEKRQLEQATLKMNELQKQVEELNQKIVNETDYSKMNEYTSLRDSLEEELEMVTLEWLELEEKKEAEFNVD